jgi:hypothetical protein
VTNYLLTLTRPKHSGKLILKYYCDVTTLKILFGWPMPLFLTKAHNDTY